VDNGLKYIGKAIAIIGVWLAWAFAIKALGTPMIRIAEESSRALAGISVFLLFFLYLFLTIIAYSAMSAILDRWDKS